MLSATVPRIHTRAFPAFRTCIQGQCRHISSEASASLRKSLVTRPPNIIYDYLSPTPSHLLNISLSDFLPESCYPSNFRPGNVDWYSSPYEGSKFKILPQGHHLVYFPPQVPANELLPDGTDLLHSPGEPFVRRMWAGGSLSFNQATEAQLPLDGRCKVSCVERISDVHFKDLGVESNSKVFVDIERRISLVGSPGQETSISGKSDGGPATEPLPSVVETRTLVFMKPKTEATAKEDAAKADRMVKVPQEPGFYVSIKPNKSLLFRFSALTFNAHAIHLNPQYARDVEGYRDLLVHGPLTLVLMLSVLRSQLQPGQMIKSLDYRNLAPLYADEEMRICTKQRKKYSGAEGSRIHDVAYDVWIERWKGGDRGLAVRGIASIGQCQSS